MIGEKQAINASATVNEVIAMYPETITVFNAFGIDMCCGGDEPLDVAARDANVDPRTLLTAVQSLAHREDVNG